MPDLTLSISLCKAYCPPQTGKGHGGGGGGYGKGGGRNEVSTFPLIGYIQNVEPDLSSSIPGASPINMIGLSIFPSPRTIF